MIDRHRNDGLFVRAATAAASGWHFDVRQATGLRAAGHVDAVGVRLQPAAGAAGDQLFRTAPSAAAEAVWRRGAHLRRRHRCTADVDGHLRVRPAAAIGTVPVFTINAVNKMTLDWALLVDFDANSSFHIEIDNQRQVAATYTKLALILSSGTETFQSLRW